MSRTGQLWVDYNNNFNKWN